MKVSRFYNYYTKVITFKNKMPTRVAKVYMQTTRHTSCINYSKLIWKEHIIEQHPSRKVIWKQNL